MFDLDGLSPKQLLDRLLRYPMSEKIAAIKHLNQSGVFALLLLEDPTLAADFGFCFIRAEDADDLAEALGEATYETANIEMDLLYLWITSSFLLHHSDERIEAIETDLYRRACWKWVRHEPSTAERLELIPVISRAIAAHAKVMPDALETFLVLCRMYGPSLLAWEREIRYAYECHPINR